MKIVVLVGLILFILLSYLNFFLQEIILKQVQRNHNETTIDLEKDPKTKEYKPKE